MSRNREATNTSPRALEGKRALVTGATRGIGMEIARDLAVQGAEVCISGRSEAALEKVSDLIESSGGICHAVVADLYHPEGVEKLVRESKARLGGVDILVNNAGVGSRFDLKPVMEFDLEFWERSLFLNLTAPMLLCRALVAEMASRKWGRVVNISSINGKVPSVQGAAYVASKHGLIGLTRTLALEMAAEGITVNAVCPGPVDVGDDSRLEFDARRLGITPAQLEARITPIGRRLVPEEIAPLVTFLCMPAAGVITGQSINVDGGAVMS